MRGGKLLRTLVMFALAGSLPVAGCDCNGGSKALVILTPEEGATLTQMDDADPGTDIIDVELLVASQKLGGAEISIYRSDSEGEPVDMTPLGVGTIGDDGRTTITVPFEIGEHTVVACADGCTTKSSPRTFNVGDACADITFVNPSPPAGGGDINLGPMADTDGDACGASFSTNVLVSTNAGDGQNATLYVNGTPATTVTIDGMLAQFEDVVLGGRGPDDPNSLEVEVQTAEGLTCRQGFPGNVYVDCDGPSCQLTAPDTGSSYLNQDDDTSADPGFQGNFEATTNSDGVGQDIVLYVDGAEIGRSAPVAMGTGGTSTFTNVDLEEGTHLVQAECSDAAGNRNRSEVGEWTVDITPCGITINTPTGDELFTDTDDLDPGTDGIQIDADGTISGSDCSSVDVGVCGGTLADATLSMGDWMATPTLPTSTGTHGLCAEVTDEAGNIGEASVDVDVRTDAPQLEIVTPSSGDGFNRAGTDGRTADLDDTTDLCEAAFTVNCTDVGVDVEVLREGTDTALTGGTATCEAMAGLPSPYEGRATFASVAIPSRNDGSSLSLVARQQVDGLVGLSPSISVTSDCDVPELVLSEPATCDVLRPSTDDSDPDTAGFQHDVIVSNTNTPKPPVTVEIQDSAGSVLTSRTLDTPTSGALFIFQDVDFAGGGERGIVACSTDSAGNVGCADTCTVTVADLPVVTMEDPTDGAVLTGTDDCDGGTAGLQVRVRATTNAADGSSATVQIGTGAEVSTTVSGGEVNVCTDAADARDAEVRVTVTDATSGTSSSAVTVDIDTQAPTGTIDDLSAALHDIDGSGTVESDERREGTFQLSWTAVDDAGGFLLDHYELRCSKQDITTEAEWDAARTLTFSAPPEAGGSSQRDVTEGCPCSTGTGGFRAGVPEYCVLRGVDVAGRLTPLGPSALVGYDFEQVDVTHADSVRLGSTLAPVGDVNGDGIDDVLMGAPVEFSGIAGTSKAYLYFGTTSGLPSMPDVIIEGVDDTFGAGVAGIGDFSGDGQNDFAISSYFAGSGGKVYVFYGRPETTSWPTPPDTINLADSSCEADVCFAAVNPSGSVYLGLPVSALDLDGDGTEDLVLSATGVNGGAGRIYVIRGGTGGTGVVNVPVGNDSTTVDEAGPPGFFVDAPADAFAFGWGVGSPGDISGTAADDLVITSIGDASSGTSAKAYLLEGRSYTAPGLQQVPATALTLIANDSPRSYRTVAFADHDGDSMVDLLLGFPSSGGYAGIYPNVTASGVIQYTNDLTDRANDGFGAFFDHIARAVLSWRGNLGDLDGDGVSDLLLGSNQRGTGAGSVELFYGSNALSNRVRSGADVSFQPSEAGARRIGEFIGDVNGDGFPDLAVGDRGYNTNAGRVRIFY